MKFPRQAKLWLAFFAAGRLLALSLRADDSAPPLPPVKLFPTIPLVPPPLPQLKSPVTFFRQLLAMSPAERFNSLTNRTPEVRERLLAKLREYQMLPPDERELRLRETDLRWYLLPLLRTTPANRDMRLAQVPDELRDLVKTRLTEWDVLPPPLQQEFLNNERALRYFSHVDSATPPPPEPDQTRWNALSDDERQRITDQFNHFFELTPAEKQQALTTLSATEQQQMETTLQTFGSLPPAQRSQCIRGFTKFAGMSAAERAAFLKNAERWSQMSPAERQTWRDLVTHVPQWPPLPPGLLLPPMPPKIAPHPHPVVATTNG